MKRCGRNYIINILTQHWLCCTTLADRVSLIAQESMRVMGQTVFVQPYGLCLNFMQYTPEKDFILQVSVLPSLLYNNFQT